MKIVTQAWSEKRVAMMRPGRERAATSALLLIGALLIGSIAGGCKKEETPPPLPQAKPATTPTAVQLAIPKSEDAGAEKVVKKTGKGGGKAQGTLGPCCAALRQNAASAPPETQGHMLTAANACDAANAAGGAKSGFAGVLGGLLRGAGAPAACQ